MWATRRKKNDLAAAVVVDQTRFDGFDGASPLPSPTIEMVQL